MLGIREITKSEEVQMRKDAQLDIYFETFHPKGGRTGDIHAPSTHGPSRELYHHYCHTGSAFRILS
jgi:hypothetical protein